MTDKEIKKSLNRIMSDPERKYVCGLENRIEELEAEIERLKRGALSAVLDAKLPYERQAAGRDDSGVALTLQRQRSFTLKAVRKVFDTLTTESQDDG